MDQLQRDVIRRANSMEIFADGDTHFNFGLWREWRDACVSAGRTIPPAEFKAAHGHTKTDEKETTDAQG